MKTIDTELKSVNNGNYAGILMDPIEKHSRSVLAKNTVNPISNIK